MHAKFQNFSAERTKSKVFRGTKKFNIRRKRQSQEKLPRHKKEKREEEREPHTRKKLVKKRNGELVNSQNGKYGLRREGFGGDWVERRRAELGIGLSKEELREWGGVAELEMERCWGPLDR